MNLMNKPTLEDIKKNLKDMTRPLKIRELAKRMGIRQEDYPSFRRMVKEAISYRTIS